MQEAESVTSAVLLMEAIKSLDEQRVRSLIESSCELDFFLTDSDGISYTPLIKAVAIGAEEIVGILLEGGAGVNKRDPNGCTALHCACVNGFLGISALCVKYGADVDTQDNDGCSALLAATVADQTEAVKFLIQQGSKVSLANFKKETALSLAAQKMNPECAESLLSAGASVNDIKDSDFQALFFFAQQLENTETVIKMAKLFIEAGAEINFQGSITGSTPLHLAVMVSNIPMVKLLLDSGADPNLTDYRDGENALTLLRYVEERQDALEIAKILVDAGAKVNAVDKSGKNALFAAIHQYDPALANYLIQQGIHMNTGVWDALDCAVTCSNIDIVGQLLQAGAAVDGALHTAVILGRNSMAHMLLEYCAVPTLKTTTNPCDFRFEGSESPFPVHALSPLSAALFSGNIDMACFFLSISFLTDYDIYGLTVESYTSTFLSLNFSHSFLECQALLETLVSQPWPLEAMAFVAVSTQLGREKGRQGRIDELPLPAAIKRRLRFFCVYGESWGR